jgi:murein DD-endopeptidase MepM/ murein hydrolase activator NlpD
MSHLLNSCPRCGAPLDPRTPHVVIEGTVVRAYCSASCVAEPEVIPRRRARSLDAVGRGLAGLLVVASTTSFGGKGVPRSPAAPSAASSPAPAPEPPHLGPSWPPSDEDWRAVIAADLWLHPLDGPERRMPISDARVFGAERPGDRPIECRNGHCGVDLSGPWGEPVHAAHDGVVDRVERGPNEDHGGLYVRLAHRDGTIFTQYFHLAAIPRRLEPGVHVRAGEVIGLLGDTGIKRSRQHLHFALSVKPAEALVERYVDPEPLIALWPLRVHLDGSVAMVSPEAPGLPHGAARPRAH